MISVRNRTFASAKTEGTHRYISRPQPICTPTQWTISSPSISTTVSLHLLLNPSKPKVSLNHDDT